MHFEKSKSESGLAAVTVGVGRNGAPYGIIDIIRGIIELFIRAASNQQPAASSQMM